MTLNKLTDFYVENYWRPNTWLKGHYLYQKSGSSVLGYTKQTAVPPQPAGEPWVPLHGRCSPPICAAHSCVVLRCCRPAPGAELGTDTSPPAPPHESAVQSAPIAPLATILSVWRGRKHENSVREQQELYSECLLLVCMETGMGDHSNYVITLIVLCVLSPAATMWLHVKLKKSDITEWSKSYIKEEKMKIEQLRTYGQKHHLNGQSGTEKNKLWEIRTHSTPKSLYDHLL